MRLAILNNNLEGEKIAYTIYNEDGIMFLKSGTQLTQRIIKRLQDMGINTVYIYDKYGDDSLALQEVLDSQIKIRLIKALNELFVEIKKNNTVNYEKSINIVEEIINNINLSENAIILNNFTKNKDMFSLANHSIDVTLVSIIIASYLKYDAKKMINLSLAALLHDIGKIIEEDYQKHPEAAYNLLKGNVSFKPTTYISVLQHHEFEDGSGPMMIQGEKIYEFAKIINISDLYVNFILGKDNLLPHEAIEKITTLGLNKLNEEIFKGFINSIRPYPNGLKVRLNTGDEGVVISQNKNILSRPIIMITSNNNYEIVNLEFELSKLITEVLL
ncbi:Ribonuclease Y [Caloramator mitchellensis]|uniref:Ribonuclease Y n=1 Tax=Caloramator mitchellensis TaxID=908809 RepID=A0A0R3JQT6_CALMK|nr:HD domain-containing protein [Caloramator mitchellensis]KRQ85811.1 Ribonuclease Y [Caloramator mitchellensis]